MLKKTIRILLALTLALGLCSCALSRAIEGVTGGGNDDPNLGLWKAATGEMLGMSMDVADVFGKGFTIELRSGGKCTLMVDGDKASGKWTLDDAGAFTVKGGGVDAEGTLKNGKLVLADVLGMGLTLTFEKEGGSGGASGGSAAKADADYFVLSSITESGETISGADLAAYGLDGYYILLHKDGKAEVMLDPVVTGTWKNGEIDLGDMGVLEFTIKGDELTTEIEGSALVYTRSKEAPPASGGTGGTGGTGGSSSGGGSGTGGSAGSLTSLQQWWNGDWYGYWEVTGTSNLWSDMEGGRWDCYAQIDIGADGKGIIFIWDDEVQMALGEVEVTEAGGSGAMGAAISTGGTFGDDPLERADWIIDPSLYGYDNYMVIDGHYDDPDDSSAFSGFDYYIVLRPWGIEWSDIPYGQHPPDYYTWYLDNYTKAMPGSDAFGESGGDYGGSGGGGGDYGGSGGGGGDEGRGVRGTLMPNGGTMSETEVEDASGKTGVMNAVCPEGWHDLTQPDWVGYMQFSSSSDAWDGDASSITITYSAWGASSIWSGKSLSYGSWEGFYNDDGTIFELISELGDDSSVSISGKNIDPDSEEFQNALSSIGIVWD